MPESVLKAAQSEITDYRSSGMSVMEMSHRSKLFADIFAETKAKLKRALNVPDTHEILFLQGGATLQFAAIPLNLMGEGGMASYAVTGNFSNLAAKEAKKYGTVSIACDSSDKDHSYIPAQDKLMIDEGAKYFYYCANNTIYGTEWQYVPETGSVPLVCDMSSDILSRPVNVADYGLIYAGAQKNVAPAGVTIVIIRKDLIGKAMDITPTMLNYQTHADNGSMFNTPPCYAIYIAGLTFKWIKKMGGLEEMKKINEKKAKILYDFLDSSKLFKGTVVPEDRSLMNVPFVTGSDELDAKFVAEAKKAGFVNIKGHRTVGGMRASIYNAMPVEGVEKLVEFMKKFEEENA